jgi:hypothetical protein
MVLTLLAWAIVAVCLVVLVEVVLRDVADR